MTGGKTCLRANCAANRDGRCICLNSTEFRSGICPFYKDRERAEAEKAKCRERLERLGLYELLLLENEEEDESGDK